MSSTWKYRHNSFASARKRKQHKSKSKSNKMFSSPDKKRLFDTTRGSWYEQEKLLQQTGNIPKISASHKNFLEWDSDDSTELESDYENTDEKEMDINYWIIDMKILDTYICDVAVSM